MSASRVVLKQGLCSWTDATLVSCGRFYPQRNCSSAHDRLEFYAKQLPCVEVDTSNYAIPQKKANEEWIKAVPTGFVLHFKAYGLCTLMSVPTGSLPWQVRDELSDMLKLKEQIAQSDLTDAQIDKVFAAQNEALAKFHDAGKLGVVVFQFQANHKCSNDVWTYVLKCRALLDKRFTMAVEFRATSWFDAANVAATLKRCRDAGIVLIGVDELIESEQSKHQKSLVVVGDVASERDVGVGLPPKKVFVCVQTVPDQVVVRVHRRVGDERRLSADELREWHDAIVHVAKQSTAPTTTVWMLWNSNHEDHSIVNANELAKLFTKADGVEVYDWKGILRERELGSKKSILGFFGKKPAAVPAAAAAASSSPAAATAVAVTSASAGAKANTAGASAMETPSPKKARTGGAVDDDDESDPLNF
jgi:uncharacterized protein YecE (DUF72 family)